MNPITLKNEFGETIEVKWDGDGCIQVRHSDIDKTRFGRFHEFEKRARVKELQKILGAKGIDTENPVVKELLAKMGGYLVIDGKTFMVNATETVMIIDAVKKHGGIVPNWTTAA